MLFYVYLDALNEMNLSQENDPIPSPAQWPGCTWIMHKDVYLLLTHLTSYAAPWTPWRPVWTPAVHIQNPQAPSVKLVLSSAGSWGSSPPPEPIP